MWAQSWGGNCNHERTICESALSMLKKKHVRFLFVVAWIVGENTLIAGKDVTYTTESSNRCSSDSSKSREEFIFMNCCQIDECQQTHSKTPIIALCCGGEPFTPSRSVPAPICSIRKTFAEGLNRAQDAPWGRKRRGNTQMVGVVVTVILIFCWFMQHATGIQIRSISFPYQLWGTVRTSHDHIWSPCSLHVQWLVYVRTGWGAFSAESYPQSWTHRADNRAASLFSLVCACWDDEAYKCCAPALGHRDKRYKY